MNKVKRLKAQIEKHLELISMLKERLKEVCPHNRLFLSGGEIWHNYPEYRYHKYRILCLDCNKVELVDHPPKKLLLSGRICGNISAYEDKYIVFEGEGE